MWCSKLATSIRRPDWKDTPRPVKDTPKLDNDTTKPAKDLTSLSVNDILAVYHFADFRDVPGLADLAVSVMLEKIATSGELLISALEYLLEHIPDRANGEHCHMFVMLVNIAARYVSGADFTLHMIDIPPEFLIAVVNGQRGLAIEEQIPKTALEGSEVSLHAQRPTWMPSRPRHGLDPINVEIERRRTVRKEKQGQMLREWQAVSIKACKWHLHEVL
jgi:hypothetical protein